MSLWIRSLRCLLAAVLAATVLVGGLGPGPARAQAPGSDAPRQEAPPERGHVRLRYGASLRRGGQQDAGPGLSYAGHTFNDLGLEAVGFEGPGPAELYWGFRLALQREAFTLSEGRGYVTQGSLARGALGPALQRRLGPLRAELAVAYELSQLPLFGDSSAPQLSRATRHAALLGARLQLPLARGLRAELSGGLPLTLSAQAEDGAAASASGLRAGAALLVPLAQRGHWTGTLVLDAQHQRDRITVQSGAARGAQSEQRLTRLGLALQVGFGAPPLPRWGSLRLTVRDGLTGLPLRYVPVSLRTEGAAQEPYSSDGSGVLTAAGLAPGMVQARLEMPGYLPTEAHVQVAAGGLAYLELRAQPVPFSPPPTGALRVRVVDGASGMPLAGALVEVGGEVLESDGDGEVHAPWLTPGPHAVRVAHEQYRPGEEAVVVVAGTETRLPVPLTPLQARPPALLLGQVRSASLGRPLHATLRIPGIGLRTVTNEGGAFSVRVPGGTYRVIISAGQHLTQTKTLTVRDGEQAIFNVDLFPSRP